MPGEQLYCGCCGGEIGFSTRTDPMWCRRCRKHVNKRPDLLPEYRTYHARYGVKCPYQRW